MRSQKQTNRSPRPLKTKHDRWSGNSSGGGLIPPPKFPQPAKKKPDEK
jgi:hypothetical protein